jgi:hypothetical protein
MPFAPPVLPPPTAAPPRALVGAAAARPETGPGSLKVHPPKSDDDAQRVDSARASSAAVAAKAKGDSKGLTVSAIVVFTALAIVGALIPFVVVHSERDDAIRAGFDQGPPIFRSIALAVATIIAWFLWRRRWRIVDTPTVEVAGVHPGVCEMTARVRTSAPVTAWATSTPCVAYTSTMTVKQGKSTRTLWERTEIAPDAWLDDGTGSVRIDVEQIAKSKRQLHRTGLGSGRTFTEMALVDGDELYVLATVRLDTDGQLIVRKTARDDEPGGSRLKKVFHARFGSEQRARTYTLLGALISSIVAVTVAVSLVLLSSWSHTYRGSDGKSHTEVRLVPRVMSPLVTGAISVAIILGVLLVAYLIRWWNRFVALRNQVNYATSFIDTAVQQRHDLIGQLLPGVASATSHETMSVGARLRADAPQRAMVVARIEQYPHLTADVVFRQLFEQLQRRSHALLRPGVTVPGRPRRPARLPGGASARVGLRRRRDVAAEPRAALTDQPSGVTH